MLLCASNEKLEELIFKKVPFTVSFKNIWYLGISLEKKCKPYGAHYKSILKDFKEGLNSRREIPCPWIDSTT